MRRFVAVVDGVISVATAILLGAACRFRAISAVVLLAAMSNPFQQLREQFSRRLLGFRFLVPAVNGQRVRPD
ncbi:MAG TPA: hypothetical protein VGA56_11975 [Opitutaceae bacterium]